MHRQPSTSSQPTTPQGQQAWRSRQAHPLAPVSFNGLRQLLPLRLARGSLALRPGPHLCLQQDGLQWGRRYQARQSGLGVAEARGNCQHSALCRRWARTGRTTASTSPCAWRPGTPPLPLAGRPCGAAPGGATAPALRAARRMPGDRAAGHPHACAVERCAWQPRWSAAPPAAAGPRATPPGGGPACRAVQCVMVFHCI